MPTVLLFHCCRLLHRVGNEALIRTEMLETIAEIVQVIMTMTAMGMTTMM